MPDPLLVPPGPLVDVPWLAAHAGDSRVRVVDCRWYLGGRRGADEYARGHIPGAVHLDVDADLSGPAQAGPAGLALDTRLAQIKAAYPGT